MNKWIKRGIILSLGLLVALVIWLSNRPLNINVDNIYSLNDVGTIMTNETGTNDSGVPGYDKVLENDFLALYVKESKSYFAIKDKRNDYTWYSTNTKPNSLTPSASTKNLQNSTLLVNYLQKDGTITSMDNYSYSIDYKKDFDDSFSIEYLDNGIKITYTLRDRSPKGYWFPAYISADRFNELVKIPVQLNGSISDLKFLLDYYGPNEQDPNLYEFKDLAPNEETGLIDMNELKGTTIERLFEYFYEIGYYGNIKDDQGNYTEEYSLDDVMLDNEEYDIQVESNLPEFTIPLEITLNDDSINAEINYFEIEEKNGYEIVGIEMLPYFGSQKSTEEGYLIIPEGSGGLINFNNGKTESKSYSSYIYQDDNLEIPEELIASDVGARLPILGIKTTNNSMLGIIETGISHSKVTADVSEKYDSFNKIYNEFIFRQSGSYKLAENKVQLWSEEDYTYSPNMKYYFFNDEDANYSSMATLYGKYLEARLGLEQINKEYSLYMDILGSYDYDSFFLWFPTNETDALTTYEEAELMIEELKGLGVSNQTLRYVGWFNSGIKHGTPKNINLDHALGSKRDFNNFMSYASENNFDLYYDVDFVKSYENTSSRNYSRVIGGTASKYYEYSLSSNLPNKLVDPYYLSNVASIDANTDRFLQAAIKYNLPGISFRNLGDMIYSDYKNDGLVSREFTSHYYQDIFAKFETQNVMVENANFYALANANAVTDLETNTSKLVVVDAAIPFYQIAIAPYIDYSLKAYNFGDVFEEENYILKALETGSNLKVMLSYRNTAVLQDTDFKEYYSVSYDTNKDEIVTLVTEFNSIGLESSVLTNHEVLIPGVVQVTYSNNKTFIINYTEEEYSYLDYVIDSKGYLEVEVE